MADRAVGGSERDPSLLSLSLPPCLELVRAVPIALPAPCLSTSSERVGAFTAARFHAVHRYSIRRSVAESVRALVGLDTLLVARSDENAQASSLLVSDIESNCSSATPQKPFFRPLHKNRSSAARQKTVRRPLRKDGLFSVDAATGLMGAPKISGKTRNR